MVSNADAKTTFLRLVESKELPDAFVRDIQRFRMTSPACKVNLALAGLPRFTALPEGKEALLRGSIEIAPSIDYVEQAYDDAKYGGWSRRPFMDALIPSLLDPGMAPPGKHVMSLFVEYASSDLEGGWTPAKKAEFLDVVVDTLAEYAPTSAAHPAQAHHHPRRHPGDLRHHERPHLPRRARAPSALLPPARAGLGGYKTPIRCYWQCGAGTHPGGGIMGASGRLAAMAILRAG